MNAARELVDIPTHQPERIVVIHDDIMQPLGDYKIYQGPHALHYNALSALGHKLGSD